MPRRNPCRSKLSVAIAFAGAWALVGCDKQAADAAAASPVETRSAVAPAGACRLLESDEVNAVFPGVKPGEADDSRKQYGIVACTWSTPRGTFVAQYWESEGSSAKDEASGLIQGVLDPLKGAAAQNNIRYENVPGVGEQAVAVIEAQDADRGVLNDFAMLVAQSGKHIVVLIAPQLARSERAKAIEGLQSLGKSAVSRL